MWTKDLHRTKTSQGMAFPFSKECTTKAASEFENLDWYGILHLMLSHPVTDSCFKIGLELLTTLTYLQILGKSVLTAKFLSCCDKLSAILPQKLVKKDIHLFSRKKRAKYKKSVLPNTDFIGHWWPKICRRIFRKIDKIKIDTKSHWYNLTCRYRLWLSSRANLLLS